jgi:uncharacterized protein
MTTSAFVLDCGGVPLVGILHRPTTPPTRGVVMVTAGGPQYRVGGHRQLTLWSRQICATGLAVLRFDYRGTGDSGGDFKDFTHVDDDIQAAVDHLVAACPSVREVVLWGECNAASAILYYAHRDPRVTGAVMLNPWVHTEAGAAKATLKYYYLQRLMQPSFWRKLVTGRFKPMVSLGSALQMLKLARGATPVGAKPAASLEGTVIDRSLPLTEGLLIGLQRFSGRLLIVLSGRDPVAHEYDTVVKGSPAWQQALSAHHAEQRWLATGDHTFSSAEQRAQVASWAIAWLGNPPAPPAKEHHGTPDH